MELEGNPGLGSLGRFPFEIRTQIYSHILDAELMNLVHLNALVIHCSASKNRPDKAPTELRMSSPGSAKPESPSRKLSYIAGKTSTKPLDTRDQAECNLFNVKSYAGNTIIPISRLLRIRETSVALRDEVQQYFLLDCEFRLDCVNSWTTFLTNIHLGKRCWLRHVFFNTNDLRWGHNGHVDGPQWYTMVEHFPRELRDLRTIRFGCTRRVFNTTVEVIRILTRRLKAIESDAVIGLECLRGWFHGGFSGRMELALEGADHDEVWEGLPL